MSPVLLIILLLLVFGFLGAPGIGPWSHGYGWYPSGGLGLVVLILVILLLAGRL